MDTGDILSRPAPPPDRVLRYGNGQENVADLRFPMDDRFGESGVPLVIFLHGGFWRAAYDRTHTGPLAVALAAEGFAVCTPEFRRIGQPEGGWPGTFDDVAAAAGALPGLAAAELARSRGPGLPGGRSGPAGTGPASGTGPGPGPGSVAGEWPACGEGSAGEGVPGVSRVIFAGHSAGGHLALWLASRHRLPAGSRWHVSSAGCDQVVALAAVTDLVAAYQLRLGNGAVAELLGGGPGRHADRYAQADPAVLLPSGVRSVLVHGRDDDVVPSALSTQYAARARAAGDEVTCRELAGTGHFEVIDPLSRAWAEVLTAFS
ncbi:MAG TPA: alpha/beta hydrolase [Streptosporangiaceae bacterium]